MLADEERRIDARFILSVVACGIMSFAGVVVETAMNITFPVLMGEFGVDTATVQWITTGYLLVLAIIMPLSALLKRRFRTKQLFAAAAVLFIAGTLMCAAAPTFPLLVAGRLVQGVGTGIALPLMFNIVLEQAPRDKLGLMMGVATLITATAPAVGPSVGGLIVTTWGWRAIFVVLLPFLAAALVAGVACIRQVEPTQPVRFSLPQFLLLAGSFTCLVFATSSASTAGWLSVQVVGLLAAFALLLALYCAVSRRSDTPLIRVEVFARKTFALSAAYVVLLQAVVLGLGYLIPYYAQVAGGLNEFTAGCLLLPGCLVGAALAPVGGRILDKLGAQRPITAGGVLQLAAVGLFALLAVHVDVRLLAAVYVLVPIAQGLSMANSMTNGLSCLPEPLRPDGNASLNTLQQLGGALGTAVATSVMNAAQAGLPADLAAGTAAGMQDALLVLLAVSAIALCCVLGVFAGKGGARERR